MKQSKHLAWLTCLWVCLASTPVHAEGSDQLNTTQALRANTQLYVDVVDPNESIEWTGVGQLQVSAPDGTVITTLASGEAVFLIGFGPGAYGVRVMSGQVVGVRWDIAVGGESSAAQGRLHSYDWRFNAGSFSETRSTNASFYAVIPGGRETDTAVIELKLDGLAGYVYNINANRSGVDGPDAGRSVAMYGHTVTPEFPIYLSPPASATYSSITPSVYGLDFIGGVSVDVDGNVIDPCQEFAPGESFGRFQFDSDVDGTFHLQCDLNRDGVFDASDDADFLAVGDASIGTNTYLWNGEHNGAPVDFGAYACRVRVNVGEFHYVGADIETSYAGMRMFEVAADGSRRGLDMFWNDAGVQGSAQSMPSGEPGLESSGIAGVSSGDYTSAPVANGNARSWGAFNGSGKGNVNYLDTYVWLSSTVSSELELRATDPNVDTDGDGLGDFEERCSLGTDPENPDSDGDGVNDGEQYGTGSSSGSVGGLESNGRMASQLATRAVQRTRATMANAPEVGSVSSFLIGGSSTSAFLEAMDLRVDGLERVTSTPADLSAITNATDVLAYDYVREGEVRATFLVVETSGELYEHSKALCDRAGGSTLTDVGGIAGDQAILATFRNEREHTVDRSIELKLFEQADGQYRFESHWLPEHYSAPSPGQRVLNVQLWSRESGATRELFDALLESLRESDVLARSGGVLDESTVETWRPVVARPSAPSIAATEAKLLGETLSMSIRRFSGDDASDVRVRVIADEGETREYALEELLTQGTLGGAGIDVRLVVGLLPELTVELYDDGQLTDRVWLSDGAWTPFDDSLWGGGTELSSFSAECDGPNATVAEGLELSGCGRMSASAVDTYAGVARHVPQGVSTTDFRSMSFRYRSAHSVEVCVEDTRSFARRCRALPAKAAAETVHVSLSGFQDRSSEAPLDLIHLVTFTMGEEGDLAVSRLAFGDAIVDAPASASCSLGQGASWAQLWLFALAFGVLRRRRSNAR